MKKLVLITIVLLITLGVSVMAGANPGCYVKTGDKTYFGQKLRPGLFSMKITSDDGTVVKVPNNKVKSYMDGTRFFELLPVVGPKYDTTGYSIMELVTSKNGLKLFSYQNAELPQPGKEYYVFDDERLFLKIDKHNAANVLAFFGLEAW